MENPISKNVSFYLLWFTIQHFLNNFLSKQIVFAHINIIHIPILIRLSIEFKNI